MKYTSSEANKLLRKLNQDYAALCSIERESCSFLAATGEDPDSVRPEYDYKATQDAIAEITSKIRTVKHAINVFNTTTLVPGFDMTIDEMLVYLPQLTDGVSKLNQMSNTLPKARVHSYGLGTNATIDYKYANYDISEVRGDYETMRDLLFKAQSALDEVNTRIRFEINI